MLQAPAIQALLLQCLALPVTAAIVGLLDYLSGVSLSIGAAALLQGVIAAAVSHWRRLAVWWIAIQLLFPVALVVVLAAHLPPVLFLILFLVLLVLYWSSFRTQVPYYPSTVTVWHEVDSLLPAGRPLRFIDIGSGFGGLVMYLAARRPDGVFTGIELAPLPWIVSSIRARIGRSTGTFVRGDYMHLDFATFDVIFAYLSPAAMPALWEKAHSEMRSGSMLISYEFAIPGAPADRQISVTAGGPPLYIWYF